MQLFSRKNRGNRQKKQDAYHTMKKTAALCVLCGRSALPDRNQTSNLRKKTASCSFPGAAFQAGTAPAAFARLAVRRVS